MATRSGNVVKGSRVTSGGWKRRTLVFCLACSAVYALFNPPAMAVHPDGTLIEQDAEGYSFLGNFYSDLGMTRTYAGAAKVLSLILFATALALMGIALVLFFAIVPGNFTETRLARVISRLGSRGTWRRASRASA